MTLQFTGTAETFALDLLLPEGKKAKAVLLDGNKVDFQPHRIEKSNYVCLNASGVGVHELRIQLR